MKKIFVFLIALSLPLFSVEMQEEIHNFENLRVVKNPSTPPRGLISSDFLCQKSTLIQSIELNNIAGLSPETSLFLHCSQNVEELIKFYEGVFLARDWRILQKDNKGNKSVILGENPSKKVMTVLIRDEKDYRVVKIFYRRPGF